MDQYSSMVRKKDRSNLSDSKLLMEKRNTRACFDVGSTTEYRVENREYGWV